MFRLGYVELAPLNAGGSATYDLALQLMLESLAGEMGFEVVRFVNVENASRMRNGASEAIRYRKSPDSAPSLFGRLLVGLGYRPSEKVPTLARALQEHKIDLAWFPVLNRVISTVHETPFVMTVWDVVHRDIRGFPEFSHGWSWAEREASYVQNIGRAFHVVTDSRRTGESLEKIYGLYAHNWSSLGLPLPAEITPDFSVADQIGAPYFYYPVSYWPHKNHRLLIDALEKIAESGAHLVFSGHDEGHRDIIEQLRKSSSVRGQIKLFGRLSDAQVQGLILASAAVVMPSLLGPTNYPPLEALKRGKPALVSHVHEYDEEPESGLVVLDGFDSSAWAQAMTDVLKGRVRNKPVCFEPTAQEGALRAVLEKYLKVQHARGLE